MEKRIVLGLVTALAMVALLWITVSVTAGRPAPQGIVAAGEGQPGDAEVEAADRVDSEIYYQGLLTDDAGNPLSGAHGIRLSMWTAATGGTELKSQLYLPTIEDGLVNLPFAVTRQHLNGQELWMQVEVNSQTLTPRQEILPVPYAFSLREGATISGTTDNLLLLNNTSSSGGDIDTLTVFNNSGAGEAVEIGAQHTGLVSFAVDGFGVWGDSDNYWGVYGKSGASHGVYGRTDQADMAGVYALGKGEHGIDLILGGTGSNDDNGVLSSNQSFPGSDLFFYSNDEINIHLDQNNDEPAGIRVFNGEDVQVFHVGENGNLVVSGSKTGYVVDIARNVGSAPLEPGDLVVIAGVSDPVIGQIPVIDVRRATSAGQTSVAGVVDQAYLLGSSDVRAVALGESDGSRLAALEASEVVNQGEYCSVVTHGAFRWVKADASYGAIEPGDLLVSSATPGHAMKAEDAKAGALVGKALGALASGRGLVPVLVTLQ